MPPKFLALTPDHLPELLDLCKASLPLDPFNLSLLEKWVPGDPRYEPELTFGIYRDGRLAGAAVGVVHTLPEGDCHGWIKLLAVDPAHRRRGLGTALLAELERRFRDRQIPRLTTTGYPHYFWPGVDVRYTPACCLFERLGFTEQRYTINMAVDLDAQSFDTAADERRLSDQGFTLHRADTHAAMSLRDFIDTEWPIWRHEVDLALANDPVSLFYATRGEQVVAYAAYDVAMFKGTFGSMGTDPAFRGQGIGAVLLRKCLTDMKQMRYPRCEIAWVGPVSFYASNVGAVINRVFREYRKSID
jgi:GNAT superfamily N-acetyltransferase